MEKWKINTEVEFTGAQYSGPILLLPYDKSAVFIKKHGKRVILTGPDQKPLHRAIQLRKDGYAFIMLNQQVLKAWQYLPGDAVTVDIREDDSEFGMAFPEEFQVTLDQDPEAKAAFLERSPGKQRGVLHYIDSGKSEATRIKRALEMADRLKNKALHGEENYGN